jgi:hypothetical protein
MTGVHRSVRAGTVLGADFSSFNTFHLLSLSHTDIHVSSTRFASDVLTLYAVTDFVIEWNLENLR